MKLRNKKNHFTGGAALAAILTVGAPAAELLGGDLPLPPISPRRAPFNDTNKRSVAASTGRSTLKYFDTLWKNCADIGINR